MKLLDRLIGFLSYLLIPAVVLALSVFLLLQREDVRAVSEPLPIRVLADEAAALSPAEARARLQARPAVDAYSTHLAESPFWLWIPVDRAVQGRPALLLPSRHTREIECWSGASLQRLGRGDRERAEGAMAPADTGFSLRFGERVPEAVLCRGRFSGPAKLSAELWPAAALTQVDRDAARAAGMLEGALLALVFFALAFSLLNRDARYLLLATWLFANLRLAALSIGWDDEWMGMPLPAKWLEPMRQLSIAAYYLLTFALFDRLFGAMRLPGALNALLAAAKALGLLLLAAAILLPFRDFLPLMWGIVAFGIAVVLVCLLGMALRPNGRGAMYYGGALLAVLAGSASEIVSAAFGFDALMGVLNNVTAALASSGLAVLAFTEQLRNERRRREQAQRELARTYENAPIGLFTLDESGRIRRCNSALREMLGLSSAGEPPRLADFFAAGEAPALQRALASEAQQELEIQGRGVPERARWYQLRALRSEEGIEGSLQDVSERVAATRQLGYLADHDSVTGARNRRGLEAALERALAAGDAERPGALAYLNVDRFKLVNELHGYAVGDEVLRQLCARIQQALPAEAVVARLSGDTFLLLFADMPLAPAVRICQRIQSALAEQPVVVGERGFPVGAAFGVLELTPGMAPVDAISSAERACQEAKRGARMVVYDRNARALVERVEELRVIKSMDRSEAPAGLRIEMQPILSLQDPFARLDFEVLLRMEDAEGRSVPVGRALAAAETSGNMIKLDRWVLGRTLQWLREHRRQLPGTRFVCVNLSGISLNDEGFIETVLQTLADYADVAPLLCLEITEAVALRDLPVSRRFMERLRQHHVRVALDDFGAGYTSFNYLRELEAEVLKIDGSLVRDLAAHPRNAAIVSAIVALARNMGMRTIAEWAEDAATIEALAECGADYVQGWAIGAAQKPEAILQARSSADFVQDEAVLQCLRRLAEAPSC
jgi:diguanylate cyclase (GGDEF)-like protein